MMSLKSINQDDLRNHNLSVVLDTMLRSVEPLSRAELAKATGLTKATMSLLIPMLIAGKAVREGSPASLPAQGRPSTPLSISGGRFCGIGLQINTDGFGFTAVDISGEIVAEEWISETMTQRDPEDIFGRLDELVRQGEAVIAERGMTIVGSGLALPGLVTEDLRLLTAHNLGWQQLDLRRFDVISRLDPHPDNEANMAALAQIPGYATQRRQQGIVGPADSFIYISTDIGIGGAVVHEGRVEHGDHGFAGELGHISVALDGPVCRCGRRGCLESYAGRRALVESAGVSDEGASKQGGDIGELLDRWNAGEEQALRAVDTAVEAMSSGMASVINILDVSTVILGGIWGRFGQALAQRIEKRINPQILGYPEVSAHVQISDINTRPALLGAAEVGLRRFHDDPLSFLAEVDA
ncbi:ROK family protein [Bifidobacterium psychraerophilum]|uniref:ROK family protein n=1 Tax=Bifidobacterium psychraerophilum TaxID=218140 RepID=UPI003341C7B9